MIDKLKKLEAFADWAYRDHFWQAGALIVRAWVLLYCRQRRSLHAVYREFDYHMVQCKRWEKHQARFQELRRLQLSEDFWDAHQKIGGKRWGKTLI